MAGIGDDLLGDVGADGDERLDIQAAAGIAIAHDDLDGHLQRLHLIGRDGESAKPRTSAGLPRLAPWPPMFSQTRWSGLPSGSHPMPPEDHAVDPVGMGDRQLERDHAAHGITDDIGRRQVQVIQQAHHVVDHLNAVVGVPGGLVGLSVPAAIEGDDAVVRREIGDDPG